jgi:hypothetical protein
LPFVVAPIVAAVTVVAAALVDFVVRIVVLFAVGLHRYRQHDHRRAVLCAHPSPLPFVVAPIVAAVTVVAAALVDFVVRIVVLFAVGLHLRMSIHSANSVPFSTDFLSSAEHLLPKAYTPSPEAFEQTYSVVLDPSHVGLLPNRGPRFTPAGTHLKKNSKLQ